MVPAKRTKIVFAGRTPPALVKRVIGTFVKLFVLVAEICHPEGGVRVTLVVRFEPLRVKDWLAEGAGSCVLKFVSAFVLGVSTGGGSLTIPESRTVFVFVPLTNLSGLSV